MSCITTQRSSKQCNCGTDITKQMVQEAVSIEVLLSENKLREEILTLLQEVGTGISVVNIQSSEINTKLDLLLNK